MPLVKCHESPRVHRLVDDELDAADRRAVERHIAGCQPCAEERRRTVALRGRLRNEALRHELPATLLARVSELVETQAASTRRPVVPVPRESSPRSASRRWYWLGSGALGGSAATAAAFVLVMALDTARIGHLLVDEAVAAHGRAATTGHLVDVPSSDLHTVKPWLSQRLDYSPPVPDLRTDGFTLLGGRLDRLDQSPVATLVYGYGHHTIDVFVRPSSDRDLSAPAVVRGFNVIQSRGLGMDWVGVSDVNATQLGLLMQRLSVSPAAAGPEPAGATR